ncbi:hypothetical protein C1645_818647 [Glomus cerebriforme]|uniref:Uncharacterized protein n=1 Tax=Glomus cerebriforme TaxID=658196 RepID=A0A397T810_9GLOM|nr:hypothetical protein C1645_818647 [Glomus cerebriforme]
MDQNKDIKEEMKKLIEGITSGVKEKIWKERYDKINKISKYIDNKQERYKIKKVLKNKNKKTKDELTDPIEVEEKLIRLSKNNIAKNNKKLMSTLIANRYIDSLIIQQEKVNKI